MRAPFFEHPFQKILIARTEKVLLILSREGVEACVIVITIDNLSTPNLRFCDLNYFIYINYQKPNALL